MGRCSTGGRGTGKPHLASAGSVVLSDDGRWLLVVNAGSDEVSLFAGQPDGLRLAVALWPFWLLRGFLSEGRAWLERALAANAGEGPAARARALACAGHAAWLQGDARCARVRRRLHGGRT